MTDLSGSQMKKLILIIVAMVLIVGGVFFMLFFFDGSSTDSGDIEMIKANGGYEQIKVDLIDSEHMRDSQAAEIADILFEDVGITQYQGIEKPGRKGTMYILANDYKLDTMIRAGEILTIYIGDILVYQNLDSSGVSVPNNVTQYTFQQYDILVETMAKGLKIDKLVAQNIYEELSMNGITGFTNIKSGKLNGVKGFYGYEGELQYFMILENDAISKIYVVCDGFDPLEVYNSNGTPANSLSNVKVLAGTRQGIANVLSFKVSQVYDKEVIFPAALLTGDDSWLMVRSGEEIYIEVRGEIVDGDKRNTEDIVLKLMGSGNDITYLKIGRKVIVGE